MIADYVELAWGIKRQSHEVQWLEFRLNGTRLWYAAYWINLCHPDRTMDATIMVLTDNIARHQQDERLWTLANHDALTELPNRTCSASESGRPWPTPGAEQAVPPCCGSISTVSRP